MRRPLLATLAAAVLTLAACGTADTPATPAASGGVTPIKLQLQWFYQAQFAGYIAAVDRGFYSEQGLDVQLLEGGVDIVPQTVLAQGKADYAVAWVPKALASREQGAKITDVGQIFARSGTYQVAWKNSGIAGPADFKGKKVGNWGFGNEFELFAGMTKAGLDPGRDVTLVQQQFDMQALLKKEIDAAQAMSYNEYAQLLEAKNPATGKLYTADDFTVIDWKTNGSAMLQDAVWANTEKLGDPAYQQQTVKFLAGTIKGWAYCRDNPEQCRDMVVAKGSKLGKSHQLWQMNEVNKLIWPSKAGIGLIDEADWKQTVDLSMTTKNQTGDTVLTKQPEGVAYTNDYVRKALDQAKAAGVDVTGAGFKPSTVTLSEGGA
ncbi:nitrate ABC transporter substrate-binding protein [Actinoplanes sp. NBRC 14428]|uniref:Thiamine pyrimidine synthase n=1 Tax=Pseudosporangium ferrugineum TaxID=439699 RepID=A0A2T0RX28_9ACTN|nr:ABC transporter substrate-binding protein [Pseudosporangium ferrugineum]PRY25682.1 NitT/TauT family transport system substrate-binding protein [Pseudosporangium ferrugineum]BCJ56273.1 nitrate ABC transporter substrate-binding protein [Actinoplanes sp. NBRC 14428]